jgi:hypothetical protein
MPPPGSVVGSRPGGLARCNPGSASGATRGAGPAAGTPAQTSCPAGPNQVALPGPMELPKLAVPPAALPAKRGGGCCGGGAHVLQPMPIPLKNGAVPKAPAAHAADPAAPRAASAPGARPPLTLVRRCRDSCFSSAARMAEPPIRGPLVEATPLSGTDSVPMILTDKGPSPSRSTCTCSSSPGGGATPAVACDAKPALSDRAAGCNAFLLHPLPSPAPLPAVAALLLGAPGCRRRVRVTVAPGESGDAELQIPALSAAPCVLRLPRCVKCLCTTPEAGPASGAQRPATLSSSACLQRLITHEKKRQT